MVNLPRAEVRSRLSNAFGQGDSYRFMTSSGALLEGEVWNSIKPGYLTLTVAGLDDSLLSLLCEKFQTTCVLTITWIFNGAGITRADEVAEHWRLWLESLFPESQVAPEGATNA